MNARNPLEPGQHNITRKQMSRFLQAVQDNEDLGLADYGYNATVDSVLNAVYGKGDFEMLQDVNATAIGDFVKTVEMFNKLNGTNYDAIRTPTETVVFDSRQIKSAEDNVGTFDRTNSDTRAALAEENIEALEYELLEAIKTGQYDLIAELIEEYRRKGGEANRRRKLRAVYERAFYADKVKKLKLAQGRAMRAIELENEYEENTRG